MFHTHVVVDWSARSTPSPARPARDSIWWAVARDGEVLPPECARTRHDAVVRLTALIAAELDVGRRIADLLAKGAKTVWQLARAGSVGSQMRLGLPGGDACRRIRA